MWSELAKRQSERVCSTPFAINIIGGSWRRCWFNWQAPDQMFYISAPCSLIGPLEDIFNSILNLNMSSVWGTGPWACYHPSALYCFCPAGSPPTLTWWRPGWWRWRSWGLWRGPRVWRTTPATGYQSPGPATSYSRPPARDTSRSHSGYHSNICTISI